MVLVSLTSIAIYNDQNKIAQGVQHTRVLFHCSVFFFQLFMSRHVSVLYRLLLSSDVLLTNRDAKVAIHNVVITKQHRYLVHRRQA